MLNLVAEILETLRGMSSSRSKKPARFHQSFCLYGSRDAQILMHCQEMT